MIPTMKLRL